jgi:hypothetical protein
MSLPAIVAETAVAHLLQIHGVLARSTELPIAVGVPIAILTATTALTIAPWSELLALVQQRARSALTTRRNWARRTMEVIVVVLLTWKTSVRR